MSHANHFGKQMSVTGPQRAGGQHLALVFNIDHTNAMACANAARGLLSSPAEQAPSRRSKYKKRVTSRKPPTGFSP